MLLSHGFDFGLLELKECGEIWVVEVLLVCRVKA